MDITSSCREALFQDIFYQTGNVPPTMSIAERKREEDCLGRGSSERFVVINDGEMKEERAS